MIKCLMHSNDQYKINLCNYLETLITLWDYELGKRGRGSVLNCIGFVFASSWDLLTPPSAFLEGILCFS